MVFALLVGVNEFVFELGFLILICDLFEFTGFNTLMFWLGFNLGNVFCISTTDLVVRPDPPLRIMIRFYNKGTVFFNCLSIVMVYISRVPQIVVFVSVYESFVLSAELSVLKERRKVLVSDNG